MKFEDFYIEDEIETSIFAKSQFFMNIKSQKFSDHGL